MTPSEIQEERDAQRILSILNSSSKSEEEFDLENAANLLLKTLQNGEKPVKKVYSRKNYRERVEERREKRQKMTKLQNMVNSVEFHRFSYKGAAAITALSKQDRYIAIAELRKQGKSWDEIADLFDYKNARTAIEAYRQWASKYAVQETVAEVRSIHDSRLEEMYKALRPAIEAEDRGTPRAVEVAIKVLERQARLHGVDAVEEAAATKGNTQQQAVVISITAHPGDEQARQLIIEGGGGEMGRGEGAGQVLPPSSPSLPEPKEDNLFGRRDVRGENVVRSLLDSSPSGETPE